MEPMTHHDTRFELGGDSSRGRQREHQRHRIVSFFVLKLTLLPSQDSRLKVGEPSACKALTTFAFLANRAETSAPSRGPLI